MYHHTDTVINISQRQRTIPIAWPELCKAVCPHCLSFLIYLQKVAEVRGWRGRSRPSIASICIPVKPCIIISPPSNLMLASIISQSKSSNSRSDFWTGQTPENCSGHLLSVSTCWYTAPFTGFLAQRDGISPLASNISSFFHCGISATVTLSRTSLAWNKVRTSTSNRDSPRPNSNIIKLFFT